MKIVFEKKRILAGLLLGLISYIICTCFYSAKAGIVFGLLFVITGALQIKTNNRIIEFLSVFVSAAGIAICFQLVVEAKQIWLIEKNGLIAELALLMMIISFFYIIILDSKKSVALCMFIALIISTIDRYLIEFRGTDLLPLDFLSVITANNVFHSYHLFAYVGLVYGVILGFIILFAYPSFSKEIKRKRLPALMAFVVFAFIGYLNIKLIHIETWPTDGSNINGFITNFSAQLIDVLRDKKPSNYNKEAVSELEKEYDYAKNDLSSKPDIIVIMDESFADLRVLGNDINTSEEIMPFYDSLSKNAVKGYALSSTFGGGTANSEYEFLTGNTMGFLTDGATVYQLYLNDEVYSLARYLKSEDYYSFATHPYLSSGWSRTKAYPLLGFDSYTFSDDYPKEKLIRGFVSDQEMFEYITGWYENWRSKNSGPLFLFGVSMQNHGDYDYEGEGYIPSISLNGYSKDYKDVEQYLGLIHETDKAFEYLIRFFEKIDHEVVICFFGDHLPKLDQDFYLELHGSEFDDLDEKQLLYTVPFVVWTNYDIEEKKVNLSSLNYLSTYVLEAAGIDLPPYNAFLRKVEQIVPSINSKGFLSKSSGSFISLYDATGNEKNILIDYQILQYNSLFEKKEERSARFFNANKYDK